MNAARILSIIVVVFFMTIIGLLWTALDKVTAIEHTVKAAPASPQRYCKRLDLSDDLDMLGYSGCRIEMDLRGTKLLTGQTLLLNWGLEVRKGALAEQLIQDGAFMVRKDGGTVMARGGDERFAPGKVELAVIYRRGAQAFDDAGARRSPDEMVGQQRIRLDGHTFSSGRFAAIAPGSSVELIPFRNQEFPLNEPFTALEYAVTPSGPDGKELKEEKITLRWLVKFTVASQQSTL